MICCPLKLILFGEHSVLEGGSCLSISIKKYCEIIELKKSFFVKIIDQNNNFYYISIESENPIEINNHTEFEYSIIKVNSYFGCGLGTSASISLLLAYIKLNNIKINEKINIINTHLILKQALAYEKFFHYKSSGVDVYSCFYGGLISFQNDKIDKLDLNHIEKYKILLYDSKISKKTSDIVQREMKNKKLNIEKLAEISKKANELIKNGFELKEMYKLIREAQDTLEDLELVPIEIQKEVRRLRNKGIESKMSGAGFGGHLFTFVQRDVEIDGWLEIEIERCGFRFNID